MQARARALSQDRAALERHVNGVIALALKTPWSVLGRSSA